MILPGSYAVVVLLLFLGMLAWGTWANTFKASEDKWRYELYCFDFALGILLAAVLLALTFGDQGFDGFSFTDDLRLAGKRQVFLGFCAGGVFNLGNMLLLGAISLAGMAISFPIAMGTALVVGAVWSYLLNPVGSAVLLFGGAAVAAGAVAMAILAYRFYQKKRSSRVIILSLVGGLFLGSFAPLVQQARTGENGLGPYSTGFIFALGVLLSTFVFNLFFMNLPVKGEPIEVLEYVRARAKRHGMGILGGTIWYVGLIATLIAGRVEGAARVEPAVVYPFTQGGIIIAMACGLYIWKELPGADMRVKTWLGLTVVLLVTGISLTALAAY